MNFVKNLISGKSVQSQMNRGLNLSRRGMLQLAGAAVIASGLSVGIDPAVAQAAETAKLFYTKSGSGAPVVFIHGWACDSHDWSAQIPEFEKKFTVIAPDMRGHGRSEVTPSGTYMPTALSADVIALLEAEAGGQKAVLIGHSMGGQIAARVASERPDLVEAVVSVDGALGWDGPVMEVFRSTSDEMQKGQAAVAANEMFKLVYDPATLPAMKTMHARRTLGMPNHVVAEAFPPLFFGEGQVGEGKASEDFLRSLTVPVYQMNRDPEMTARMTPWFAHEKSKVDTWTDAGHWIHQDRPDDVNKAIIEWIESL